MSDGPTAEQEPLPEKEPADATGGVRDAGPEQPVRYERHGAAALITINRPERRNAIDGPTAVALHQAFMRFERDQEAGALVLTGAGADAFCAGADLKALDSFAGRLDAAEGPLGISRLTPSKPTIAAISGYCLAGGLELALWCDLRIATDGSTLGFTERRFGVPLIDGGTQRLPRMIGLSRALDLILTGRMVGAEEAFAMGLVNQVVQGGTHVQRALELAHQLTGHPQGALLADRRAAIAGLGTTLDEGLAMEARAGPEVFGEALSGGARFAAGEGRGGRALAAAAGDTTAARRGESDGRTGSAREPDHPSGGQG
ncbi:MAG: crotonase/enoyl-CoA hydratase family protein [Solirubrobacteraceae bacterium]